MDERMDEWMRAFLGDRVSAQGGGVKARASARWEIDESGNDYCLCELERVNLNFGCARVNACVSASI